MSYEVYEDNDCVLPDLKLPNPCEIRVEFTDESVILIVGQRDWSWNRKTGLLNGAGFRVSGEIGESNG